MLFPNSFMSDRNVNKEGGGGGYLSLVRSLLGDWPDINIHYSLLVYIHNTYSYTVIVQRPK